MSLSPSQGKDVRRFPSRRSSRKAFRLTKLLEWMLVMELYVSHRNRSSDRL